MESADRLVRIFLAVIALSVMFIMVLFSRFTMSGFATVESTKSTLNFLPAVLLITVLALLFWKYRSK